jgi:hypothetical protein
MIPERIRLIPASRSDHETLPLSVCTKLHPAKFMFLTTWVAQSEPFLSAVALAIQAPYSMFPTRYEFSESNGNRGPQF